MTREKDLDRVKPYIVINQHEEAFIGLLGGQPQWSDAIDQAKPFSQNSKLSGLKKFCPEYNLTKFEI